MGNLIQAIPLENESIILFEKSEEIIEIIKNNNPYTTQFIFNQDQDLSVIELIIKVIATIVIKISTIDLLTIIRNGINIQEKIKSLW